MLFSCLRGFVAQRPPSGAARTLGGGLQDGQVRYRWRAAKSGRCATRTLPGADFLWLLLLDVLPRGLQRTRNFGFRHHSSRRLLRLLPSGRTLPSANRAAQVT